MESNGLKMYKAVLSVKDNGNPVDSLHLLSAEKNGKTGEFIFTFGFEVSEKVELKIDVSPMDGRLDDALTYVF